MGRLARKVGLFGLTASGVGMILGAGIYALIGSAAGVAGNAVWLSFALGAFISSFTGLSYAELSSMFPTAAAEVSFAKASYTTDMAPFLIGWVIIFTEAVSTATVALGFGGYFQGLFGLPIGLTAMLLIAAVSLLTLIGIEESSRLNIVFTLIEGAGLLMVVGLGLPYLGQVNLLDAPNGIPGILKASTLVFFAYLGFQDVVNLAEEATHPERDVPRALMLSVVITALCYVFVAVAAVSLVDWQALGTSNSPLAFAASQALGQRAFMVMAGIALFATANTVLILVIVTSRMIYGMARSGYLPTRFARTSQRGSPWVAVLIALLLSAAFVLLGNITFVAEITNLGTFITFASVNVSAILLRIRKPDWNRPFKTPFSIKQIPLIPLVGLLSCSLMVTQFRLDVIGLTGLVIISGVLVYTLSKAAKSKRVKSNEQLPST
jgi:APA family basic amino acid/polyamine antiporter